MATSFFILSFIQPIITWVLVVLLSWRIIRKDINKYIMACAAHKSNPAGSQELINAEGPSSLAEYSSQLNGVNRDERNTLLQLRLQAHERLIVFIDRLNPANLFLRLHQPGITAQELQGLILNEVRSEYQHNVSQQLYLSAANWIVLSKLKEDTLAMINNAVAALPAQAAGVDLSRKVLEHVAVMSENPYDLTISLLKKDIHQLF
jgi:hypothetical protein